MAGIARQTGFGRLSMTAPFLTIVALAMVPWFWLVPPANVNAAEPVLEPTPAATITFPASPPQTGLQPTDASGGLLGFLPDPKEWAADVFNQVLTNLLLQVVSALRVLVKGVLDSSLNFVTQTPPAGSYGSPTVQTLWGVIRAVANTGLVLVALWGGFSLIVRGHLGSPYHEAMELFPRLVLGALLVNTSLWSAQFAIDANNALCGVIGQASLPALDKADGATQLLVEVIAIVFYLVTGLLLLLQMLMRLALIDVLLVVSPLGLLCWVLPQTQGWARLWSSTFFAAVFTQFVQVLALKLGGSLLTDLTPMVADASLLALFLGIAVLTLTMKIPGLMRNHLGDGLGFVRYVVYRQGAKALEGRGGADGKSGGGE